MDASSFLRNAAVALLALACLGFGALAYRELDNPPLAVSEAPPVPRTGTATAAAPQTATSVALPPLQNFAAVVQRPLFSPDRRPPPIAENAGDWSSFVLAGIVIGPSSRAALIQHGRPPTIATLTEGQSLEGWTVAAIHPDRVVFRNGTNEHELRLNRNASGNPGAGGGPAGGGPPAPVPPATAQMPATPGVPTPPARQAPVRPPPPG